MKSRAPIAVCVLLGFLGMSAPARALQADELLLLTNKNVPESMELAQFYRNARLVPDGRILALDVPAADEITFADYEIRVVPVVRQFLRERKLQTKVTCLVTFYGLPLRIGNRVAGADEKSELAENQVQLGKAMQQVRGAVWGLEDQIKAFDKIYAPQTGDDLDSLIARAHVAMRILGEHAQSLKDPQQQRLANARLFEAVKVLGGPAGILRTFGPATHPAAGSQPAEPEDAAKRLQASVVEARKLEEQRSSPDARQRVRAIARDGFGMIEYARLLQGQIGYLATDNTASAFDNELPLLWWDYYPRTHWQPNPWQYKLIGKPISPALMTMRLDAPTPQLVREMILASVRTEKAGLRGKVVLDSRGLLAGKDAPFGGYAWYDQSIRNLADLVKQHTKLELLHDDTEPLLKAGAADDVALYCGWYSVRHYVPCCKFKPGAVAFHVASFELVSLHAEKETGWCAGLIKDGAAATLGPVAEPYLHAFPPADEFFPLLLTGELPLAEVYWRTNPMTSWMMGMVGDPLYRPYKANPALKVADLPQRLRVIFTAPATAPAVLPSQQ